jgi:hypothetical protein
VSFLFAGWDKHHGFQLYESDPAGTFGGWAATVIGANFQVSLLSWRVARLRVVRAFDRMCLYGRLADVPRAGPQAGKSLLKNEYVEDSDVATNLKLAAKVRLIAAGSPRVWG